MHSSLRTTFRFFLTATALVLATLTPIRTVSAQSEDTFEGAVTSPFSDIKVNAKSGIFANSGFIFDDPKNYGGQLSARTLSPADWLRVHNQLVAATVKGHDVPEDSLVMELAREIYETQRVVPIVLSLLEYDYVDRAFVDGGGAEIMNGKLRLKGKDLSQDTLFTAGVATPELLGTGPAPLMVVPEELVLTNLKGVLEKHRGERALIEIDAGLGFRRIELGTPFRLEGDRLDSVAVRVTLGGRLLFDYVNIHLPAAYQSNSTPVLAPALRSLDSAAPSRQNRIQSGCQSENGALVCNNVDPGAAYSYTLDPALLRGTPSRYAGDKRALYNYAVYLGSGNTSIRRPIIVVDGLDPANLINPAIDANSATSIAGVQIDPRTHVQIFEDLLNENGYKSYRPQIADELLAGGYDVLVFDPVDTGDLIQRNGLGRVDNG